jgi:ubiquitin C-terminal hydrolase
MWECGKCNELKPATRLTKLESCPEYLIVHLKRFKVVFNKTN